MPFNVSFEKEMVDYLEVNRMKFEDHRGSTTLPDFFITFPYLGRPFVIDTKEKRQVYNMDNWGIVDIPQEFLTIVDDLTSRKILMFSPYSGFIIRDNLTKTYCFFSILDLYLMPRKRINRPQDFKGNSAKFKGKWLLDTRNGVITNNLDDIFSVIRNYIEDFRYNFLELVPCYGNYIGEDIPNRGDTRTLDHINYDYKVTR